MMPYELKPVIDHAEFADSIRQCNQNITFNLAIIGYCLSLAGLLCFLSNFITPWVIDDLFANFWILPVCGFGGIMLMVTGQIVARRLGSAPTVDPRTMNTINEWYNSEERARKRNAPNRVIRWTCVSLMGRLTITINVEGVAAPPVAVGAPVYQAPPAPVAQQFQSYYPQQQPPAGVFISQLGQPQPAVVYHSAPAYPQEGVPPAYAPGGPSTPEDTSGAEGTVYSTSVAQFCSRCGKQRVKVEDRFCSGCGVPYS